MRRFLHYINLLNISTLGTNTIIPRRILLCHLAAIILFFSITSENVSAQTQLNTSSKSNLFVLSSLSNTNLYQVSNSTNTNHSSRLDAPTILCPADVTICLA